MKIILSRKGFDSGCGKMPSPILPDGTLLSLPIPDNNAIENTFGTLQYNGKSFYDIIHSVNPKSYITPNAGCHLDPDLRMNVRLRCNDWQPAFGQTGAALGHLDNQGVAQGDLFLFFGWFRQTLFDKNRQLHFDEKASDIHVIYGYMQIGDIIREQSKVPDFLLVQISEHCHPRFQ